MKTIIAFTFLVAALTGTVSASKYEEVMKENIEKIYQAETAEELTTLANKFERIGQAENDKWLPGYYAAYCYVESSYRLRGDDEAAQKQLDKAQSKLDKLMTRFDHESEIYVLQALIYNLRITDMSKGAKYSGLSLGMLNKAEQLDSKNPRVYYLRGTTIFYTPENFGGGAEKARPLLEKAAKLFASGKSANELTPTWGEAHNKQMLSQCK